MMMMMMAMMVVGMDGRFGALHSLIAGQGGDPP